MPSDRIPKLTGGIYYEKTEKAREMSEAPKFPTNERELKEFRENLGEARFDRYSRACGDDAEKAIALYMWNARISQEFYLPLQIWEVCLRNQMNRFLCWKFQDGAWPYNEQRALRQLNKRDQERLSEAKSRQQTTRGVTQATTDAIAADLSAGFWVSMLTSGYNAKFAWRYNLVRVFPGAPEDWLDHRAKNKQWSHSAAHEPCQRLLMLRNRIAHHEPIYHLDLDQMHKDAVVTVGAMCRASLSYLKSESAVQLVLGDRPQL